MAILTTLGAVLGLLAGGCASHTLGKLSESSELPKELSPDMKQKFEVMEQALLPKSAVTAAPTPDPVPETIVEKGTKKDTGKKARGKKKELAAAAPSAAVEPVAPRGVVYPKIRPAKDPLWVGEKMTLDVSYFAVSAGQFTIESLPHKSIGGREVYHVRGTAVTSQVFNLFYRLNDMVETFIDYEGFFSHRFHIVLDETKQARDAVELYDHEKGETYYWNRWNHKERGYTETKEFQPIPRFTQDSLSVLYYLRAVDLPDGAVITVPVVSEGKPWEAVVTVLGREERDTPYGTVRTIKLKPETRYQGVLKKSGDSFLWISDDDHRYPVRLEAKVKIGTVVAAIRSYEPGKPPAPAQ